MSAIWQGYRDDRPCGLEVFRNPRKIQHKGSKWILFRTSNGSSEGFRTAESALSYGQNLNPKMVWRKVQREISEAKGTK